MLGIAQIRQRICFPASIVANFRYVISVSAFTDLALSILMVNIVMANVIVNVNGTKLEYDIILTYTKYCRIYNKCSLMEALS